MIPVNDETLVSLRNFVRAKLQKPEAERMFMTTPNSLLGGMSPLEVLSRRDHFEVMQLSAVISQLGGLASGNRKAA
ncbi:antitoxin Xre/MbcA/ParS toxin-binding domain-containing protein [Roseivivax sp. CAU 1761]